MKHFLLPALVSTALLLTALPANACQLVCMFTGARYNGSLGGLDGADAKCAKEYPDFKFARNASLVASLPNGAGLNGGGGSGGPYTGAWAGGLAGNYYDYSTSGYAYQNATCDNWSTSAPATSSSKYGAIVQSGGTGYAASYSSCDVLMPLLCCNM